MAEMADTMMLLPPDEWFEQELDTREPAWSNQGQTFESFDGVSKKVHSEDGLLNVEDDTSIVIPSEDGVLNIIPPEDGRPNPSLLDHKPKLEDNPALQLSASETDFPNGLVPVHSPVEEVMPTSESAENLVPPSHLVEDHVPTSEDCVPRLDLAQDHIPTSEDCVLRLDLDKDHVPTSEDCVPGLDLAENHVSTSEDCLPRLDLAEDHVPTSEDCVPRLDLAEDHVPTSEDCIPRLDLAEDHVPTSEDCIPGLDLAENHVSTSEDCLPGLDLAEDHVPTSEDCVPQLDLAENHVSTSEDCVPRLDLAEDHIPTSEDCVPRLDLAEDHTPDCLPPKLDLAECQILLSIPNEHSLPSTKALPIPKLLPNGACPFVKPLREKFGDPILSKFSPKDDSASSGSPTSPLHDATLLPNENSQTNTNDDPHEYYVRPEEMVAPLTPTPGPTPVSVFQYRQVRVFQEKRLGRGSYGMVCRAMCDELPCAAKLLHPIFFRDGDPGTPNMLQRFDQECQVLSSIRHPCIVQYLGVRRDSQTRLPILLMELMDESLTEFLDRSKRSVPYHLQIDICHDVTVALGYLHTNGIIHRDLSSNNVLMIAGSRAKVTDFGMSKLIDVNPRMTPLTECPGTQVYMSPEALRATPHYTAKLDIFSAGVLMIQVVTREFPSPGDAKRTTEDPKYSGGPIEVPVPERERRRSDIDKVDPAHPLLPCALTCLADRETQRPTAFDLCRQLADLKNIPRYDDSKLESREKQASFGALETTLDRKDNEIRRYQNLVEQHSDAIAELQREKDENYSAKDREIEELKRQLDKANQRLLQSSRASSCKFTIHCTYAQKLYIGNKGWGWGKMLSVQGKFCFWLWSCISTVINLECRVMI